MNIAVGLLGGLDIKALAISMGKRWAQKFSARQLVAMAATPEPDLIINTYVAGWHCVWVRATDAPNTYKGRPTVRLAEINLKQHGRSFWLYWKKR